LWNTAFAFNLGIFFLSGPGIHAAVIATLIGLIFAGALGLFLAFKSDRR
jgi:hypothetical protein